MPNSDYYQAIRLDPAASSPDLNRQLTDRIDQTPPGPDRIFLEQARAVLGDPRKKTFYDARLRDSAAPPWTPQELHELALAPTTPTLHSRFAALIGTGNQRVLTLVAAGLVAVLVLAVVLIVSSDDPSGDTASATGSSSSDDASGESASASGSPSSGAINRSDECTATQYSDGYGNGGNPMFNGETPAATIVLTKQTPLPSDFAPLSDPTVAPGFKALLP